MMNLKVLTTEQVSQFSREGYLKIENAFARETALMVQERVWQRLGELYGVKAEDSGTWKKEVLHLQEVFFGEPFALAYTERVLDCFGDLVGENNFVCKNFLGWWPVTFPGFHRGEWQRPEQGWHVDGIQFHHHIDSPDQGLLVIFIFSNITAGSGGTAIVPGSHVQTAKILAEAEPQGLEVNDLSRQVHAAVDIESAIEATGMPGDMYLLHPFMLHSRSMNTGKDARFICNPCIPLRRPMNLDPQDGYAKTPLESSIIQAIAS